MRRTILLTRPQADSEALASPLAASGWSVLIAPLLTIHYETPALPDLRAFDGIVFTSRHGVEGFARLAGDRTLPVFAVGEKTAAAARRAGFRDVTAGAGDAEELAALLPRPGRFLHPGGRDRRRILGMPLDVYRADASRSLYAPAREAILGGKIAAIMFFSPRTGRIFMDLAGPQERNALRPVKALCLSRAVLESVMDLPWAESAVAATSDSAAMLALALAGKA